MKLYTDFAEYWPLLSPPADYAEAAAFYWRVLQAGRAEPVRTLLELGSGGGSNASHLKARARLTLVEPAEGMLAHSRRLNPECEHVQGDMRDVRLGRTFDAVFVHDAVGYMASRADLRRAMDTAFVHCAAGGAALFCPDYLRETFKPDTDHGGHDGDGLSVRFLEWTWDPDPDDETFCVDFVVAVRRGNGPLQLDGDRHIQGLFPRGVWLQLLSDVGFTGARALPLEHSEIEPGLHEVFVASRPR